MPADRRQRLGTGAIVALLMVLAACSSSATDSSGTSAAPSPSPAPTVASTTSTVAVPTTAPQSTTITSAAPASTTMPSTTTSASGGGPADVALLLPAPTGDLATGTTLIHLRDDNRIDPLDPGQGTRELMVQLWYPTDATGGALAAYAPPAEVEAAQQFYPVPPGAFTATTNSQLDAPVAPGRHDVVFFHHGLCASRTDSTIVAEQLASLGYVVVALGSTGEMPAVAFPDGRVVALADPASCAVGGDPFSPSGQEVLKRLLQVRVDDVIFTLDELGRANAGDNPDVDGKTLPAGSKRRCRWTRWASTATPSAAEPLPR